MNLPKLPPVDGYNKRVEGHYSAKTLQAYATLAIAEHIAALAPPSGEGVGAFERAMKASWEMVITNPTWAPGSYYAGQNNGIIAALKTVRENYEREIARQQRTTPQSVPVDGDWRKSYSVEIKLDPPFPYGVAVVTDANGEQSVHVHDDNPVLWHLLNKLTTPPPVSQERGDRQVLLYLMQQFDCETWECEKCGHGEDCKTMDSAEYLRSYLAASPPSSAVEPDRFGVASPFDHTKHPVVRPDAFGVAGAAEQAKPAFPKIEDRSHEIFIADGMDGDPPMAEQAQAGECQHDWATDGGGDYCRYCGKRE